MDVDATITALLGDDRGRRIRVLVRPDPASRTVSVLLALPHESYSSALRQRIESHLQVQLDGDDVDVDVSLGNRSEALVRFLVRVRDGMSVPPGPFDDIAHEVRMLCRTWDERVEAALRDVESDRRAAARLARTFVPRFPAVYRDAVDPVVAATDIVALRALEGRGTPIEVRIVEIADELRCRVYSIGTTVELSKFVPILESLGLCVLDEVAWVLGGSPMRIHQFGLRVSDDLPDGTTVVPELDGRRIADAICALLADQAEADSLNRLVVAGGLSVDDVSVLRAYRRYRRQLIGRYSVEYINDVLVGHAGVAADLVRYFDSRKKEVRQQIVDACDALARLDHDRILRGMLGTIDATLRTNRALRPEGPLALKLDSAAVPDMPAPTPYREIFVYGPAVEGVHLRFGSVARGGLRWSDRTDDYRTEVLDLARTQVLKNALIVPTGAKGGFVLRKPVPPEEAYAAFVSALLDLTDNVCNGEVEPVPGRLDGDDPYLVIAADKGTAAFSDLGNRLAKERGFWLGDAFASGGSTGYDHKALGVTARGTWVAVQRHFARLGIDVQSEPVTVAGIGDMSGDAFGNGLLQSPSVKLIAAFDHRHVFCDPDPDPAGSFAERQRLFDLQASSWADYDRGLLSEGGGVWARTDKVVQVHPRLQTALRVDAETLTPPELIQAILRAPVDLLFAGGIGTFVRASSEDDMALDDRTNSDVRVEASSLRARVVGEGANLSFTAKARIEYARRGGRINIDAIDNSAGVDTSDHEVNLKILLQILEDAGQMDSTERDRLLVEATDDVVAVVLDAVGRQADAISLAQATSASDLDAHGALLDDLVDADVLDREGEALPTRDDLDARREAGAGLTRPELAVLLAGAKRQLRAEVMRSDLPDDPALAGLLACYFPPTWAERFGDVLARHRLRRELIATVVTNDVVDRCGISAVHGLAGETGADLATVVTAAWAALQVGAVAATLTAGDDDVGRARAMAMLYGTLTRAYLAMSLADDLAGIVTRDAAVAGELAVIASSPSDLDSVPSVSRLAAVTGRTATEVASAFTHIGDKLGLDRLRSHLQRIKAEGRWAAGFKAGLVADAAQVRDAIALSALRAAPASPVDEAIATWMKTHREVLADVTRVRREVEHDRTAGLDGMAVLGRAFRRVVEEA